MIVSVSRTEINLGTFQKTVELNPRCRAAKAYKETKASRVQL